MTDYQPRPTQDAGPPQWSAEDVRLATARGDHDAIVKAQAAGQLRDLLANGDPARDNGTWSRRGAAMTPAQAAQYLAEHVAPEGASEGTRRLYTEQIKES